MLSFRPKTGLEEQKYLEEENGSVELALGAISGANEETLRKRGGGIFRFSFLVLDILALNVIPFTVIWLMNRVHYSLAYLILFIAANVFWIICAYITALYFAKDRFVKRTFNAGVLHFTALLFFIFLYNFDYSRLFVLLSFAGFSTSLVITRTIFIGTNYYLNKHKKFVKKVIVLGINDVSEKLTAGLTGKTKNFEMHGYFDDYKTRTTHSTRYPVLGTIKESFDYAIVNEIDEIYSTILPESNPFINEIAQQAEKNFIRFKFVPDFSIFINRQVHVDFLNDTPIFSLRPEPLQELHNQIKKRAFDIIFSSLIIILVLSWLIPIIAILIKLESKGPVFFKQLRSGKNNMPFVCFKFRSLRVNVDADNKQVARNDKRFTGIGKFLRKSNIDELPQFFNVLQGHMSIVGPRPHMLKHTEEYSAILNQYMVRHFIKPGVTGLAQINGYRGEIKRKEQLYKRIEYDINYMENWSMWLDMRIILLTLYTTVKGDKNAF